MAARKGEQFETRMSGAHRDKIQKSNILNALIEHVEGKREMSASQVSAGLGLLKKALPDLTTTTIEGGETPLTIVREVALTAPGIIDHG